jgi:hypothetical protein
MARSRSCLVRLAAEDTVEESNADRRYLEDESLRDLQQVTTISKGEDAAMVE